MTIAATLAAILTLSSANASAQTVERTGEFISFSGVNVTGPFEVGYAYSEKYYVKFVLESVLADYVTYTQRDNIIYVNYAEKDVPKETKKLFKGRKNPDPILKMLVYAPTITDVNLTDGAVFSADGEFTTEKLNVTLSDNSRVASLKAKADNVGISIKKKCSATMNLEVPGNLSIWAEGSSTVSTSGKYGSVSLVSDGPSSIVVEGDCEELGIKSEGSSQVNVRTKTGKVDIESANTSKVNVEGTATGLAISGKNNATIDVRKLDVPEAQINLNSATVHAGAKQKLTLELQMGSAVYYDGTPQFSIVRILKSTLAPSNSK